jgi:L-amino acid N-acyltransferase YncA
MSLSFHPLTPVDWPSIAEIYRQGIATGNATFETKVPEWPVWDQSHHEKCRLIVMSDGEVSGWAALIPVSKRSVYSGVAEVSIYIAVRFRGSGLGKLLLEKLVRESEKEGFWTLQASIFPENGASLKIHKDLGFREVGFRERIAEMNGTWRNTVLLERRSALNGK